MDLNKIDAKNNNFIFVGTFRKDMESKPDEHLAGGGIHLPPEITIDISIALSGFLINYRDIQHNEVYTQLDYVEFRDYNEEDTGDTFNTRLTHDQVREILIPIITQTILTHKTNEA